MTLGDLDDLGTEGVVTARYTQTDGVTLAGNHTSLLLFNNRVLNNEL